MTTISAHIVADSINDHGNRITTIRARYPRWIHAEGRTHRQLRMGEDEFETWEPRTPSPMEDPNLSRNAASSRAIPVKKMIEAIRADPAIPLYWGANQKGMQAGEEISERVRSWAFGGSEGTSWEREEAWLFGMEQMIALAEAYDRAGYHKQIINRLLEPWMHIETLFTATEWSNFFALRIHTAAEPHIRLLALRMREAMDASEPTYLRPGRWHLPYIGEADLPLTLEAQKIVSVARCAHLSYETVGTGEPIGFETAKRIRDQLVNGDVLHASPFEHQAKPDTQTTGGQWFCPNLHGNLVGWIQLRKTMDGECR